MNEKQDDKGSQDASQVNGATPESSTPVSIVPENKLSWGVALLADSVVRFHERFQTGSHNPNYPALSIKDRLYDRQRLFTEELVEYQIALEDESEQATLEELVDMIYVLIGHLESAGPAGITALNTVREKNDRKTNENYGTNKDGKITKRDMEVGL